MLAAWLGGAAKCYIGNLPGHGCDFTGVAQAWTGGEATECRGFTETAQKFFAIFAEVAETMGCSRKQNSDWREGESEGVAGEGVNVVTPLPILARPRAGRGTYDFSGAFEIDGQWFLNRVLCQRF